MAGFILGEEMGISVSQSDYITLYSAAQCAVIVISVVKQKAGGGAVTKLNYFTTAVKSQVTDPETLSGRAA